MRAGLTAAAVGITKEISNLSTISIGGCSETAENTVAPIQVYLLQVSAASSEPSGHSGSPSHRQRPGTHCPFKQANSAGAHVFLAGRGGTERGRGGQVKGRGATAHIPRVDHSTCVASRAKGLKWFGRGLPGSRLGAICDISWVAHDASFCQARESSI